MTSRVFFPTQSQLRGFLALLLLSVAVTLSGQICDPGAPTSGSRDVRRLVVLFPQVFGTIYLLGLEEKIIGVPKSRTRLMQDDPDGFYFRTAPKIGEATDVGFPGQPNMETLFALEPDLVLSVDEALHPTKANKLLREAGIPLLALKGGFGSIEEWLGAVRSIARATGRESRALGYEAFFREKLRLVRERLGPLSDSERPKVCLMNANNGQVVIRGARTRFGLDMIRLAGGKTMESGKDPGEFNACAELLFDFDPDVIIDDTPTDFLSGASWWKELRAVKKGKVIRSPQDDPGAWITNWYQSTFSPLGILWLAKSLHPDRFADIDLEAERNEFYRKVLRTEYRPFPPARTSPKSGGKEDRKSRQH